jgi:hypothetical protein
MPTPSVHRVIVYLHHDESQHPSPLNPAQGELYVKLAAALACGTITQDGLQIFETLMLKIANALNPGRHVTDDTYNTN